MNEIKPITVEGAIRLATATLELAYNDYTQSLITIMKLRNHKRLSKENNRILNKALMMKHECEEFYKSKKYEIFSLGKGVAGVDVIKHAQKEVSYVEIGGNVLTQVKHKDVAY